jgi:hypothetical protein
VRETNTAPVVTIKELMSHLINGQPFSTSRRFLIVKVEGIKLPGLERISVVAVKLLLTIHIMGKNQMMASK